MRSAVSKDQASDIGLSGVAGVLPPVSMDLNELYRRGLLRSTPDVLGEFGFERAFISTAECDAGRLAMKAAEDALADAQLEPDQIDVLIWASALPANHLHHPAGSSDSILSNFQYAGGWMQDELGLINADVIAVTQQGCSTLFSALRTARALILAEPKIRHVLCVGVDVLPENSTREIMYNVISDSACAVVVSRNCATDRWLGFHQISRGYYWDPIARESEIIAAYFPTSRALIQELLAQNNLSPADIDLVVPTGVNRKSWEILLRLIQIPQAKMFRGETSFGHTVASDNFLLLQQIRRQKMTPAGAKLLLFTYGFGSAWCGLLLEH